MEHISLKQLKTYPNGAIFTVKAKNFESGEIKINREIDIPKYLNNLKYYQYLNANNYNIFISPSRAGGVDGCSILLDDISAETIRTLNDDGLEPCYYIETSPRNYQAILMLPEINNIALISKELARKYGSDPASTDPGHFHRIAGYTNRKEKYCQNGQYPYVKFFLGTGKNISDSKNIVLDLLEKIGTAEPVAPVQKKIAQPLAQGGENKNNCFAYIKKIYANSTETDISKIDFKACRYAQKKNFNTQDIYDAILEFSPNIIERKQHHVEDYISRTIRNSITP
ncbi:MAG: DNA-primase RepB domain-containing protein [bacterium]